MYVVDTPITKQFWVPIFDIIEKNVAEGRYEQLTENIYLTKYHWHLIYFVADDVGDELQVCGWLYLEKYVDEFGPWHCWEVAQTYIMKACRGMGLGELLYDFAIQRQGHLLCSGSQQTKHARKLWKRMVQSDKYHMWAQDVCNLEDSQCVIYDDVEDEIYTALPLYELKWTKETAKRDVRLFAMKKDRR